MPEHTPDAASGTMTDWVIAGFEIAQSPKYGIDVRVTDRITVQGNHVHDSALTGIFTAFSNDVVIQNNETDHNHEHGIYQSNSSTHPTIRGNKSHDNASAGIHMNGDLCEVPRKGIQHTVLVQFATVEGNIIWNNGNNTIVMAAKPRFVINIPNDGGGQKAPVGNVVENNILYTPDAGHGSVLVAKAGVAGFHSKVAIAWLRSAFENRDASAVVCRSGEQQLSIEGWIAGN